MTRDPGRWAATVALVLFTLGGCAGRTRPPRTGADTTASPAASVSPSVAGTGAAVRVSASGFRPHTEVEIGFGPPSSEYEVVARARTDARGEVEARVRVPEWAEPGASYLWVVAERDYDPKALSDTFRVALAEPADSASLVVVRGTITGEGVECPALRDAQGTLYTLAGAPGWLSPGDSVVVEGTRAAVSYCQQGRTIEVRQVRRQ